MLEASAYGAGLPRLWYQRLEWGHSSPSPGVLNLTLKSLIAIAKVLDCTMDEIIPTSWRICMHDRAGGVMLGPDSAAQGGQTKGGKRYPAARCGAICGSFGAASSRRVYRGKVTIAIVGLLIERTMERFRCSHEVLVKFLVA